MPNKKKKPKAQNGYILPEWEVTAQGQGQRYLPYAYNQPQPLPVNYQPTAQPLTQQPAPQNYSSPEPQPQSTNYAGIAGGIGQAATTIGGIFDTIGDIRNGIISGGAQILNALLPDNTPKRQRAIQYVNSQDPYGSQQYNNMFKNGGQLAQNGSTITVYDRNDPRYRAYQDSLNAYQFSQQNLRDLNITPGTWDIAPNAMRPEGIKNVSGPLSSFNKTNQYAQDYLYKGWPSDTWAGRQNNITSLKTRTAYLPIYPKPSVTVSANSTINPISTVEIQPSQPNIQMRPLAWDNVPRQGVFPMYGNDNKLIGTWDQVGGQTSFYPITNPMREAPYTQEELRTLPANTQIIPEGSTEIRNIRRMENGGELSPNKAKKILKDGKANGKPLTEKQKNYFGWVAGGRKAADGATVTNWGYNTPTNLTPAQEAALNGFIPYTTPIERVETPVQNYGYYSPNPNGTFAINTDRYLMDRTAPSGYIGDTYSYGTNRSYGYEGTYGNRNYQPQMYMNTGYNRYFQNGGVINNTGYLQNTPTAQNPMNIIPSGTITTNGMAFPITANGIPLQPNTGTYQFPTNTVMEEPMYKVGKSYDLTEAEIKRLKSMGYEIEM